MEKDTRLRPGRNQEVGSQTSWTLDVWSGHFWGRKVYLKRTQSIFTFKEYFSRKTLSYFL